METQRQFISLIENGKTSSPQFSFCYHHIRNEVIRISKQLLVKYSFYKTCSAHDYNYLQQEAEDIASDALLIAEEKIEAGKFQWNGNNSLLRFLSTIVKNLCLNSINKISRSGYKVNIEEEYESLEMSRKYDSTSRKLSMVEEIPEFSADRQTIEGLFETLSEHISSPRLKQLFKLIIDGRTDEEIKNIMGYDSTDTIRRRRYEAYRYIRYHVNQKDKDFFYYQERMAA